MNMISMVQIFIDLMFDFPFDFPASHVSSKQLAKEQQNPTPPGRDLMMTAMTRQPEGTAGSERLEI